MFFYRERSVQVEKLKRESGILDNVVDNVNGLVYSKPRACEMR